MLVLNVHGLAFTAKAASSAVSALGAFAGGTCYAVKARSSQVFGPSVFTGPRDRLCIALTFDDGPSPGTLDLLSYLQEQGVPATFFVCGANVERHPDIVQAAHAAGHEIGNHTFTHRRLCPRLGWKLNLRSGAGVYAEFARTQTLLEGIGIRPRLLRAPYGLRWFGMRKAQRQLGLLGVSWTVIGHDWEWDAAAVAALVLSKAGAGGIVCLHDGRDTRPQPDIRVNLDAVKRIVPALKQQGYTFVRVSDMLRSSE